MMTGAGERSLCSRRGAYEEMLELASSVGDKEAESEQAVTSASRPYAALLEHCHLLDETCANALNLVKEAFRSGKRRESSDGIRAQVNQLRQGVQAAESKLDPDLLKEIKEWE